MATQNGCTKVKKAGPFFPDYEEKPESVFTQDPLDNCSRVRL